MSDIPPVLSRAAALAMVASLNETLRSSDCLLQVPEPNGGPGDRDQLSMCLMAVLQATRERDAFELLYLLNARVVHLYCKSRLRASTAPLPFLDPADVVDETFMNVYLRCESFCVEKSTSFTGWVLVVAENIMRQDYRRRLHLRRQELPADDFIADHQPGPQAQVLYHEVVETFEESWNLFVRLCAAGILNLPSRWRHALELRESESLSYREIGRRMDLSTGHVGMLIRRARLRVLRQVKRSLDQFR
ncbi:MAG: sigma-70 family RNA polymerase sigma factor [Planctomycetota bacterium]